jgi:hypothetical protein
MIEEVRQTTKGLVEGLKLDHRSGRMFTHVPIHSSSKLDVGEPLRLLRDKALKLKKIEVEFHE